MFFKELPSNNQLVISIGIKPLNTIVVSFLIHSKVCQL